MEGAWSSRVKTIVQNLAVEYEDRGKGPVMLFLHGWKDNLHTFDNLFDALGTNWRILALDMPGFGGSEMPKDPWGLAEYVAFVNAFLEKIKASASVVVGHSFGGRVAIKGIATGSLAANKVVLIASAGIARKSAIRSGFYTMVAKVGKAMTVVPPLSLWRIPLRKKLYAHTGGDYFTAGGLKDTFLKVIREDLSHSAQNISIPVLLIWGSEDRETPLADGEKFASLIHGSILRVFQGAGHFVHQEKTKEVAAAIKNFCER